MADIVLRHKNTLKTNLKYKLKYRVNLSGLLELKKDKLAALITEIEAHPLFLKLNSHGVNKAIFRKRFQAASLTRGAVEINERTLCDTGSIDVGRFLEERETVLPLIQKIGEASFQRYFLFPEENENRTDKELSSLLGLEIEAIDKIKWFVNEFYIKAEFTNNEFVPAPALNYYRLAEIIEVQGKLCVNYLSLNTARGKYIIDYGKIDGLKTKNEFSKEEIKQLNALFEKIELLNSYKMIINNILEKILEIQEGYLRSGSPCDLKIFTQKDLAGLLKVHPSIVNRAAAGKCILTPLNKEIPIKGLLPNRKIIAQICIDTILRDHPGLADLATKNILHEKYNISVSRRSVAWYRKENGIKN
ncbi:MAG: hypothetical protein A2252_05680 [Elusimicrobia bacterium RIFOXYA2_FULL_39_19]|nr:MAG: hypothetical protein A2252_05680 [Elusimicrobia bacterium RIFOXYA2_FULL_39_19]